VANPAGTWNINANGYKGTLSINSDSAGNLNGTINTGEGFMDTLQGVWSESAQEIVFNRIRKQQDGSIAWIQTFTGYLFSTGAGIFEGQGPPDPHPVFLLLTGSFEALGAGAIPGRARFGWAARKPI